MTEEKNQEVMVIQEQEDGGAVVDLPPSIQAPQSDNQPTQNHEQDDSDEADERARRAELATGGEVDPDAEALREQKRLKRIKRKEYHKQVANEKDVKLHQLERQNQDLLKRLSVVEHKTLDSELARLDNRIEEEGHRVLFAKQKIKEAAETGNGDLLVNAQDMLLEASKNHDALSNLKKRSLAPRRQQTIQPTDPQLQRYAADWMSKNPWYDPNGNNADSKRALNEDTILADEGYDPKTAEYWEELTKRLHKVLPHRYTEDVSDEPRYSKPRNVVTASGRENIPSTSSGRNVITLSKNQVDAMKEAGMWENPEMRAKMIARYARESQTIRDRS